MVIPEDFSKETILLVDDNEDDRYLFQRAWQRAEIANPLQMVVDGREAIDYLEGNGRFADRNAHPFPILVLLDLKVPGKDGYEILRWIRQQPALRCLSVEVITSLARSEEVAKAFDVGANAFYEKPAKIDELVTLLRTWYATASRKKFVMANPRLGGREREG